MALVQGTRKPVVAALRTQFAALLGAIGRTRARLAVSAASVGLLSYALLYVTHQRFLRNFDLEVSDLGLDRTRLLEGPLIGFVLFTVGFAAAIVVVFVVAFVVLVSWAHGFDRLFDRSAHTATAATLATTISVVGVVLVATGVGPQHLSAAMLYLPLLGFAVVGLLSDEPIRDRVSVWVLGSRLPLAVWLLGSTALASGLAMWVGFVRADAAAESVRAGYALTSRDAPLGISLLAVTARPIRLASSARGIDPQLRTEAQCLLYLGRNSDTLALWDVRTQMTYQLDASNAAMIARESRSSVPPRCAPGPAPADDDEFIVTGDDSVRMVLGNNEAIGWQRHTDAGWATTVRRRSGTHTYGSFRRDRSPWDLDGQTVLTTMCGRAFCAFVTWRGSAHPIRSTRLESGQRCTLDGAALQNTTLVAALTGKHCQRRGIWVVVRGIRWRRALRLSGAERITSLDLRDGVTAWTAETGGEWAVRRATGGGSARTIARLDDELTGGDVHLSSVAVTPGAVRWGETYAYDPSFRFSHLVERRRRDRHCRVLATAVPNDGALDVAGVGRAIYYARAGQIGRRQLSRTNSTGCFSTRAFVP